VLEFIYMGDIFRTRLRVAGNDDFIIKTRNAPDQRRLKPGEKIEIGWRQRIAGRSTPKLLEHTPQATARGWGGTVVLTRNGSPNKNEMKHGKSNETA
jgi:uncharacterized protein YndB with AHSA1/START domain